MLARGPTTTFLDACAWKLSYVLYQCPDGRPKPLFQYLFFNKKLKNVSCEYGRLLYDTYALLNSND